MAAMDLNTSSNDGSSSSSTEPLMSENGDAGPAIASASNTAIPPRHAPPGDGQVQLDLVLEHKKVPFVEGDTWFVIDRRWFRRWQAACGSTAGDDSDSKQLQDVSMDEVGPIDNSQIANTTTGRLLRPVLEGQDVEFLPGVSWHLLEAW
jgi:ubiquitin carboxyl-terminal hydrolase 4/11/15